MELVKKFCNYSDRLLYFFIGPFAILYIFPSFFLHIEKLLTLDITSPYTVKLTGAIIMIIGGLIAFGCSITLMYHKENTLSIFNNPNELVTAGVYKYVRHPMMSTITIVLTGQVLFYFSIGLCIWLLMWFRISYLYVSHIEEPKLKKLFGKKYNNYCKQTPRWFPYYKTLLHDLTK